MISVWIRAASGNCKVRYHLKADLEEMKHSCDEYGMDNSGEGRAA
jgi:hypothetical protein